MATVIKTILALVGTIFLILTIYAGIMWMTAAGNDEQVGKAVGMIKSAVIGLVIVMSAYAITYFVTTRLTGATGIASPNSASSNSPSSPEESQNPTSQDDLTSGCCFNSSSGQLVTSIQSYCDGFQETRTPGACANVVGCCLNTNSNVKTPSLQADCTGSLETWVGGACTL